MNKGTFWFYVILLWLLGALGFASTVWTLERQTEHEKSLTDILAQEG